MQTNPIFGQRKVNEDTNETLIYKVIDANQYVVQAEGHATQFISYEDAERYARNISGVSKEHIFEIKTIKTIL